MKIQFLSNYSTSGYDGERRSFSAGQVVEVSDDFAAWLTRCGAEIMPADEQPERALDAAPHDRMARRGKRRST